MVVKSRKTTKDQWKQSYRMARIIYNSQPNNEDYLVKLRGSDYLAYYHVKFMINADNNYFDVPLVNRLYQRKLVDEIINEILEEERLSKKV